jgi:nucleotide-binding universal stress UspA family protein
VLFAGRLVRHLGADATLLSVLAATNKDPDLARRTEHFLEGGVQSLSLLGVPAKTNVRSGAVAEEILQEVKEGDYDLLVLGVPLTKSSGKVSLSGAVGQILNSVTDRAILVVRSHFMGARTYPILAGEHETDIPESGR